jgi:peptidoglycan hydrolase CwlO-like protein
MFFLKKKTIFIFLVILLVGFFRGFVYAEDSSIKECNDNHINVQDCPAYLQNKLNLLQGQAKTLSSQIAIMDNQIYLTQARIEANKREILDLTLDIDTATKKISTLSESLNKITEILLNRIVATYEVGSIQPLEILLSSTNASNYLSRLNYLRIAQTHDKKLIYDVQQAKNDYTNQKEIFETKKKKVEDLKSQLEAYTNQLNQEKVSKQYLLAQTQGSEARYQELLAEAIAEYEQIQGIVSGNGTENEIGSINKGDTIATIIQGSSCNSSGTHLHFTVSRNGSADNPFNYLKPVDYTNDSNGDAFNPSGSWDWPITPSIELHQGYGVTWFATAYNAYGDRHFHNGIDITGSSSEVKAVKSGTLYQGSYTGKSSCRLKYVRIRQSDDGLDTFYLHVNYVH